METPKTMLELLSSEDKWCKKWFAKDKDGQKCHENSPDASCWCLVGAMCKIYPSTIESFQKQETVREKIKEYILKQFHFDRGIDAWNDLSSTSYEEVKKMLEELGV